VLQWDGDASLLAINGPSASANTAANDFIHIWDVYLYAGQSYRINFSISTGSANLKVLLFRNPGSGVYWAGRNAAALQVTSSADYTAPTSGFYGLAVVNDDGGVASYAIGV